MCRVFRCTDGSLVQAPTPGGATEELADLQLSNTTSPDEMSEQAESRDQEKEAEKSKEKDNTPSVKQSSLHRKMLASHLHIPGTRHTTRRLGTGASSTPGELGANFAKFGTDVKQIYPYLEIGPCPSARPMLYP
jgi:hypothetical protein